MIFCKCNQLFRNTRLIFNLLQVCQKQMLRSTHQTGPKTKILVSVSRCLVSRLCSQFSAALTLSSQHVIKRNKKVNCKLPVTSDNCQLVVVEHWNISTCYAGKIGPHCLFLLKEMLSIKIHDLGLPVRSERFLDNRYQRSVCEAIKLHSVK